MIDLLKGVFFDTDENGNGEITETVETDELTTEDLNLIEDEGAIQEETPQTIQLGDNEYNLDDLTRIVNDYSNDNQWKAKNTQEAQRLAEEKRNLEAELNSLEQRRADLETYESSLYNRRNETTPSMEQRKFNGLSEDELNELDPATRAIYEQNRAIVESMEADKAEREKQAFINRTNQEHERLKNTYNDYDPVSVERSILKGRNQFEDAYLADTFKKVKSGDETALRSLISNELMTKIELEQRQKIIDDIKAKQKARNKISTVVPGGTKTGTISTSNKVPKNHNEARESALQYLNDNNLSLITE